MAKKSSPSADDFVDAVGGVKKLSRREVQDLAKKMDGKVSVTKDIKAGVSDFLKGRGSNRTSTPPPPPRKGRSMWS